LQRKYLRNNVQYMCAFNNKQIFPSFVKSFDKKGTCRNGNHLPYGIK